MSGGVQIPTVVAEAQKALEAGQAVVIGLQSTGAPSFPNMSHCSSVLHSADVWPVVSVAMHAH